MKVKEIKCSKCDEKFTLAHNLKRHMLSVHETAKFKCSICHKEFTRKDSLAKHLKSRCKPKGFPCLFCSKIFDTSWLMNRHVKMHQRKEELNCECGKAYTRIDHFQKHISKCPYYEGDVSLDYSHFSMAETSAAAFNTETNSISSIEDSNTDIAFTVTSSFDESGNDDNASTNPVASMSTNDHVVSSFDESGDDDNTSIDPAVSTSTNDHAITVTDSTVSSTSDNDNNSNIGNTVVEELLVSESAYRKIKSRASTRFAESISNDLEGLPISKEQEIDIVISTLKKLGMYEQISQKTKLRMSLQKKGRPITPLAIRSKVWQFWHDNSITSTATRPAKLKVNNRYRSQTDLPFDGSVTIETNKRNVGQFVSPWKVSQKAYRDLFLEYCGSNPEQKVSYGTFLSLKPFYIRGATKVDIELCCCKKHLHARWSIEALLNLCALENIVTRFENYETFFELIYGDCLLDSNSSTYLSWECSPDKKTLCGDIMSRWVALKEELLQLSSNEFKVPLLRFEKIEVKARNGNVLKRLRPVKHDVNIGDVLCFIEGDLKNFTHHRNQLKNFRTVFHKILESIDATQLYIDFAENLDVPVNKEPQSLHWSKRQLTVHSGIVFDKGVKYYHPYFSADLYHDQEFVLLSIQAMLDGLEFGENTSLVITSDNCSSQYKCAKHFHHLQYLANKLGIILIRFYGIACHGKNEVDAVGGVVKIAIRRAVAQGHFFPDVNSCLEYLIPKFEKSENPIYKIKEIDGCEVNELRSEYRSNLYQTISGSSLFQSIVFKPGSDVMRASKILCDCDLCMVEYGSCDQFQDYPLVAQHTEPKVLRSDYQDFTPAVNDEPNINNTTSDFYMPGSFAAIAADKKSTQMVWFVQVKSDELTNDQLFPIYDDYGHLVGPGVSFYKCMYMEELSSKTSKKGITYRMAEDKIAFVFKESFVYPYVNFKVLASGHYFIDQKDFTDVLLFVENSCMAYF